MTALLDERPHADRQKLRQLVRNTHEERKRNKPPHAFRELFRELRELMAQDATSADDNAQHAFDDEGGDGHA
jgi:ribosome-associated protein